jgi:phosphoglycerol transferase
MTSELLAGGIKFYAATLPPYVNSVRGLDAAENFGRWSIAKLVQIDFAGPLPDEFDLELVLGSFGPNVGANLQVIVGAESKSLRIKSDLMQMQTYELRFSNSARADSIELVVPAPTSPQAIGKAANDPRPLGIALQSLPINPIARAEPAKN